MPEEPKKSWQLEVEESLRQAIIVRPQSYTSSIILLINSIMMLIIIIIIIN
jgi:hypothetical protein